MKVIRNDEMMNMNGGFYYTKDGQQSSLTNYNPPEKIQGDNWSRRDLPKIDTRIFMIPL